MLFLFKRALDEFYAQYVIERDKVLLDIVFHKSPTQDDLDKALQQCDIEVLGSHKSLMLSYFMREHHDLTFPSYVKPRLQGLVNFYRFANIKVLSHFSKIGRVLNTHSIPILLFKGAAMKTLRPELSRPMGDVDIVIPANHMSLAIELCKKLGYHDSMTGSSNAVDIHTAANEGAVDIHSAILGGGKNAVTFHQGLWKRAKKVTTFGVDVFLPSHEDLLFIVLANLTKNLRSKTSIHGLFFALLDTKFLLADKPDFDWSIVRQNIKDTDTKLPVRLGAEFMNRLVPGIIPELDVLLPITSGMEAYCNQIVFDEHYFNKRQAACQSIRIIDFKNYPWHYGRIILKFLILKKLRNVPSFVRWYLNKHEGNHAS